MENNPEYDVLGVYQEGGPLKGTYDTSETVFHSIARELKSEYSRNEFFEFIQALKDTCERVACYQGGRYIAVNNGLIDYEDQCHPKRLLPFTPDLVFLNKSRVNYFPNAPLAIIHNDKDGTDWTVEEFIDSLVDSPEVRKLLWQILGAFIRPGGSKTAKETEGWGGFGKCILLISTVGCNGKGTFCQLVRNLCGPGTVMSIALDRLGDRFLLEPLIGKTAIITDESNVGHYLEECSDLKSLVTHDPIQINRKGRKPVEYTFCGMTMFCLNEMPRVKDKSNSFLRRLLCINFPKAFQACERKYVRDDYINRSEVLEYVLAKVINLPNYYKLGEPQECKELLADFALQNDPVRQFLDEILHKHVLQRRGRRVSYADHAEIIIGIALSGCIDYNFSVSRPLMPFVCFCGFSSRSTLSAIKPLQGNGLRIIIHPEFSIIKIIIFIIAYNPAREALRHNGFVTPRII